MFTIHCISLQGEREKNEDAVRVLFSKKNKNMLVGIFDGHGGDFVSKFLGNHLLSSLSHYTEPHMIQDEFHRVQEHLRTHCHKQSYECGSTVLVCRVDPTKQRLQVINLGDSRAVLCGADNKHLTLTTDHKPSTSEERLRLTKGGHRIQWDAEDQVYRVDGYSVSRSVGDLVSAGICQECEVTNYSLRGAKYLVMGCDGLWDVVTPTEVSRFLTLVEDMSGGGGDKRRGPATDAPRVHNRRSKNNLAYLLASHALQKGSGDNVSIVVVEFNQT